MIDLIPHIQQYTGVWSIEPKAAERFQQMLRSIKWESHIRDAQSRIDEGEHRRGGGYELTADGVAIVDLEGVLTKYGSSLSTAGSTVAFRSTLRSLKRAHESGQVKSAMIVIESPGGSTMGTPEAAEEVASLASVMPVTAYIEDIGASAAYWIASQADRIVANASAMVGSIGTYFAVDDVSQAFTDKGIKTHLFTTGKHKGAGYQGTELTEEQQAEFQSLVERMNAPFVKAVGEARGLDGEALEHVTDGRVWRGDEAVAVGLIDAVMTYDDALAELSSAETNGDAAMAKPRASTKTTAKSEAIKAKSEEDERKPDSEEDEDEVESEEDEEEMSEEKPTKAKRSKSQEDEEEEDDDGESKSNAASLRQLKAALPDAGSDFILSALEQGMSVGDAKMEWMDQTIKAQAQQIEELKAAGPKPGAKPLGTRKGAVQIDDPKAEWKAVVKEAGSVSKAVRENPELHAAYVESCNAA